MNRVLNPLGKCIGRQVSAPEITRGIISKIEARPDDLYLIHLNPIDGENHIKPILFPYGIDPMNIYRSQPIRYETLFDLPSLESLRDGPELVNYDGKPVKITKTVSGSPNKKIRFEIETLFGSGKEWNIVTELPYFGYLRYLSSRN
jgi:hypothetical protein